MDLARIVRKALLAEPDKAVAVALSGGPDSMALCHLLSKTAQDNGGPHIHALTVDHGLRPESAEEARMAGGWVKGWPCVTHHILALPPASLSRGGSRIMEKAREGRYDAMAAYCHKQGISRLFVAHHQDDQAETVLFRLARGSGLDGLAGMRMVRPLDRMLTLVRPLLSVPKADLLAYCEENAISFVKDPSNINPAYARSRIRRSYDILAGEGLTAKRLAVTAGRLARASDALDFYSAQLFDAALREEGRDGLAFDYKALERAPLEIRIRLVLKAMNRLKTVDNGEGYGPRLERLEALVMALFTQGRNFRARTLGGFIISFDRGQGLVRVVKERDLAEKP